MKKIKKIKKLIKLIFNIKFRQNDNKDIEPIINCLTNLYCGECEHLHGNICSYYEIIINR